MFTGVITTRLKHFIKATPPLYDFAKKLSRRIGSGIDPTYSFFDLFSKTHPEGVTFIQIGANDGLRNDPIREFIVRDRWNGILVDPLPTVFGLLQSNYAYCRNPDLQFVNAAISSSSHENISFWSFREDFLGGLSSEEKLEFLRKASFDKDHVKQFADESVLLEIKVPCLTFGDLVRRYWRDKPLDLLVIDAEGHETEIIRNIDFTSTQPGAIFFESRHLGADKPAVFDYLASNGYKLRDVGTDSVAMRVT